MNHPKGRKHEVENLAVPIAYIHGRLEAQIEGFAASLDVSAGELAERLGELLLSGSGREGLGADDRLPKLRRKAGAGGKGVESVEVAGGTSSGGAHAGKGGVKGYWDAMTPKQRKAEMQRRLKLRAPTIKARG
jgi:hypothetical protein